MEIWKKVEDYPNYSVSNKGRVRNDKKNGKLMTPVLIMGYHYVTLSNTPICKKLRVHRLVAKAFIPNPNNYPCVNHKDEIKTNNNVENLEWCTVEYNTNYGSCPTRIGVNRMKSVIVDGLEFENIGDASKFINCPYTTLSGSLRRGSKTCHGHTISYA